MAHRPRARSASSPVSEEYSRLEDYWDEPSPHERLPCSDAQALQGVWRSVLGRRQAIFLVAGDRFTMHFEDGDVYVGSFQLLANCWPRAMDVHVEQGPVKHRGLVAQCIYEFDGDTLRWCTASPGQSERPTAFIERDPRHLCLVFRREHPQVVR